MESFGGVALSIIGSSRSRFFLESLVPDEFRSEVGSGGVEKSKNLKFRTGRLRINHIPGADCAMNRAGFNSKVCGSGSRLSETR